MTFDRIAAICSCLVLTAEFATGQTPSGMTAVTGGATTVIERTYPAGTPGPWRKVESRSDVGSRQVAVETLEIPNVEGRLAPAQEIVTDTVRGGPNMEQSRRDVFAFSPNGRRTLKETTESVRESLSGGQTSATHNTSTPDLNGHVRVTARRVEETRAAASNIREAQSTLVLRDIDGSLRAIERREESERTIGPGQTRRDSAVLVQDVNGRWQSIEVLRGEAREMGNERTEEQTTERQDINGKLVVDERSVSRRSSTNGREQVVIETYAPSAPGSSNLVVRERVQRTTSATSDGGRSTVEEVESRSIGNPSDPPRVTRRTETTVRQAGGGRQVTERQVFERDVNGRMRLISSETEDSSGR